MSQNGKEVPTKQRALIFQGGGSLGAYEAGVYSTLVERLTSQIEKTAGPNPQDQNLFDVVAGISSGAINAAIVVSYVLAKRRQGKSALESWKGSAEHLATFWRDLSSEPFLEMTPFFEKTWAEWWQGWKTWASTWGTPEMKAAVPTSEAARRYYAARQFSLFGAPNVFGIVPYFDQRYLDNLLNFRYRFDSSPLRSSVSRYAEFPIQSNFSKNEPRLLLGAVDVQAGSFVTFDSFDSKTVYFIDQSNDAKRVSGSKRPVVISYPDGLTIDHVMASTTLPINSAYLQLADKNNPDEPRTFWDGALLNNTPLRQLTNQHRDFWLDPKLNFTPVEREMTRGIVEDMEKIGTIPELEIYIVDLWPSRLKERRVRTDNDFVLDRLWDLVYQDTTYNDEKSAKLITDYVDMVRQLVEIAKKQDKDAVEKILSTPSLSANITYNPADTPKVRKQLVYSKFPIRDVFRVELVDDGNSIANKFGDYSTKTIQSLIERGQADSLRTWNEIRSVQATADSMPTPLDGSKAPQDDPKISKVKPTKT
ncbi:MAG: patatin-like phospholipase family protein [Nitrososphaera sp.]|jgi:predicted acylesterase/phospholipase RssA